MATAPTAVTVAKHEGTVDRLISQLRSEFNAKLQGVASELQDRVKQLEENAVLTFPQAFAIVGRVMEASIIAINPQQPNGSLQRAAFIAMKGEKYMYFDEANLTHEGVLKALPDTMAAAGDSAHVVSAELAVSCLEKAAASPQTVAASVETIATLRKLLNHLIDGQHLRDGKLDGTYVDWRGDTSARYQAHVDGALRDNQEEEYWSNIEAKLAAADDDCGVTVGDGDEEDEEEEEQPALRPPP